MFGKNSGSGDTSTTAITDVSGKAHYYETAIVYKAKLFYAYSLNLTNKIDEFFFISIYINVSYTAKAVM